MGEAAAFKGIERLISIIYEDVLPTDIPVIVAAARAELANMRKLLGAADAHFACPSEDDAWDEFETAILACRAETKNHNAA